MLQHEAYINNLTPNLFQICSIFFIFVLFIKTNAKIGISVELNEYGVNLASKDQHIQELYA